MNRNGNFLLAAALCFTGIFAAGVSSAATLGDADSYDLSIKVGGTTCYEDTGAVWVSDTTIDNSTSGVQNLSTCFFTGESVTIGADYIELVTDDFIDYSVSITLHDASLYFGTVTEDSNGWILIQGDDKVSRYDDESDTSLFTAFFLMNIDANSTLRVYLPLMDSGDNGGPEVVPLPASAILLLTGLGGVAALRRRRR